MDRRTFLAAVGGGPVAGLGGCLGGTGGAGRTAVPDIGSRPCPPYEVDGRAVCSHTVDESDALVYLRASPSSSELADGRPIDEITLGLHNRTEGQTLRFNGVAWRLYRSGRGGWAEIPREQVGDGVTELPPGGRREWTFLEVASLILHEPSFEPGLYSAQLHVGAFADRDTSQREATMVLALVRLDPSE